MIGIPAADSRGGEGDLQIGPHFQQQGARRALVRPCRRGMYQPVVEIAPQLDVSARLGGHRHIGHVFCDQAEADLRPYPGFQAQRAHDVEFEFVTLLHQVNGIAGNRAGEQLDVVNIAFGVLILEFAAQRNVHVGAHHEIHGKLHRENQRHVEPLVENRLCEQVHPLSLRIQHFLVAFLESGGHAAVPALLQKRLHLLADILGLIAGSDGGLHLNAGIVVQVGGNSGVIVADIGKYFPFPLPIRAARDIDRDAHFLLEGSHHVHHDLPAGRAGDRNFDSHGELRTHAGKPLKMLKFCADGCIHAFFRNFDLPIFSVRPAEQAVLPQRQALAAGHGEGGHGKVGVKF